MLLGSNAPIRSFAPPVPTPPPAGAENRTASEKPKADRGNGQYTTTQGTPPASGQPTGPKKDASPPAPAPAPAPAPSPQPSPQPSQSASKGAEARVVGNAVPQESAGVADTGVAATTESDRLKQMRAALEVVTELAENPGSDRMAQLFAAAETKEADESDSASTRDDDRHSSIRSEQAREGYAATRTMAEDAQAA